MDATFPMLSHVFDLQGDPLQKLFEAFARKLGFPVEAIRFAFDGERLTGRETAESLDLEDEDTIDAHVHMPTAETAK